ncbi:MAG: hypothetical protein AAF401_08335, partial [Pseudomonadota bacterium]
MVEDYAFEFWELGRTENNFQDVLRPDVSSGSTAGSTTGGLTAGDTKTIPVGTELKMVIVSDNDSDFEEAFNVSGEVVSGGSGTDRQILSGDEPFSVMRLDVN